ncbi:ATP-binding protein [Desulfuribacillus stibiiarsenatis]|uniref:ATP-binding protein n=1 Tax=Desulfuribacillus stibiiarsenatis TaxID=1390249 RepID=A0A1E5L4V5_9FIRM|nr:ABC transporter ATP-binding protein [Desulfuribacillus stibiiarsenatis]OEH85094.1 ATP-binding protein [Desulfuribacillus stibiiarsenatis]
MIQVTNLRYSYEKTHQRVIDQISFSIEKGEILGFLGPSGAGKTTTQRILIGLLKGYEGSVSIMGKERREWGKDFFEEIGVAFDFPNLYLKLTAFENLQLIGSYYQKKPKESDIDALLTRVGLSDARNQKVEGFSKGMKMRLNFIRSLLHNPSLFFFDEPTSGLDPVNAKIVKDMIKELKEQGKTVFLTTHNMNVAEQLCDRVAFIVEGQIVAIDSPKELKVHHGMRRVKIEYYEGMKEKVVEFPMHSIKNNEELFQLLKTKEIKTIHSQEATLEDIFIKLTGRELT